MISKACKYGIRATVFVASKAETGIKLNVKEIAKEVDAPEAFTAKILQVLNKHRIITSMKGPYGGFFIEDFQLEQPVINVINAIDGISIFKECGMGLKQCSEKHPCPLHCRYAEIRETLLETFQNTTIGQLGLEVNGGATFINNHCCPIKIK
ncbi:RrF2 family transcriptional regulator, partial [Arcticibacter eurypsychrophilus]|uniref:RrF2 family transcriptional regulator n=1 Tax=Arcticibacter eurypsychrophilus TaxID=1434752 RepID=UPI00084D6185